MKKGQLQILVVVFGVIITAGLSGSMIVSGAATGGDKPDLGTGIQDKSNSTQTGTASNTTNSSNETDTVTENETTTPEENESTATETSVDAGANNTTRENQSANGSIAIDKNETSQSRVYLSSIVLPSNGFIVVRNESYSPESPQNESGSIIGRTQYVRHGNYSGVYVDLYNISNREFHQSKITETQRVFVSPYNDSNDNQTFDPTVDESFQNNSGDPIVDSIVIEGINTSRLSTETTTKTSQSPSSNSTSSTTKTGPATTTTAATATEPNQTDSDQSDQRSGSDQQGSDHSTGGPELWKLVAGAVLIILGAILIYRGFF